MNKPRERGYAAHLRLGKTLVGVVQPGLPGFPLSPLLQGRVLFEYVITLICCSSRWFLLEQSPMLDNNRLPRRCHETIAIIININRETAAPRQDLIQVEINRMNPRLGAGVNDF